MAMSIYPSFYQHQSLTAYFFTSKCDLLIFPRQASVKSHLRRSVLRLIGSHAPMLGLPDLASKHTGGPVVLELQMKKEIFSCNKFTLRIFVVYFKFKFKWFKYNPVTLHME